MGNFLLILYFCSSNSQAILGGSPSWVILLSLRCHCRHLKRHPAQKTWVSRTVKIKYSIVTSFKRTILHSSFSSADRTINEDLMVHCTIYTLNEGFEPICTKCYCDQSKEALMIKAYYKSYHAPLFGVCFSFKNITPWIDRSLNRIIDDN